MSTSDYTLGQVFDGLPAHVLGEVLAFHRKEAERLIAVRRRAGIRSLYERHDSDELWSYHRLMCEAGRESASRRDVDARSFRKAILNTSSEAGS